MGVGSYLYDLVSHSCYRLSIYNERFVYVYETIYFNIYDFIHKLWLKVVKPTDLGMRTEIGQPFINSRLFVQKLGNCFSMNNKLYRYF